MKYHSHDVVGNYKEGQGLSHGVLVGETVRKKGMTSFIYLFFWESEHWGTKREEERENPSTEPAQSLMWGSTVWTERSWSEPKSRVGFLRDWATRCPKGVISFNISPVNLCWNDRWCVDQFSWKSENLSRSDQVYGTNGNQDEPDSSLLILSSPES